MREYRYLELDTIEQQYYIYLRVHGNNPSNAKNYSSRISTILENFNENFIENKSYEKIPGSRKFIAFDGRYVLNKNNIEYIEKDIYDFYNSKKRVDFLKKINVDTVVKQISDFLQFLIDRKLFAVNDVNIKSYCEELDSATRITFIDAIKIYSSIKTLELNNDMLDEINKENKEKMENLKLIRQKIERDPSLIPEIKEMLKER